MELVYLWREYIHDKKGLELNFSSDYVFKSTVDDNNGLKINLNLVSLKESFEIFGERTKVTAIVGSNGSGKTSVLDAIVSEFTFPSEQVSVFICKVNGKLEVYHHESIELNINSDFKELEPNINNLKDEKKHLVNKHNDLSVIFLSNIFDGEMSIDFHTSKDSSYPNYFNLSTDYFLRSMKVIDYKIAELINGLEVFELKGSDLFGSPPFKLPKAIEITFNYLTKSKNLTPEQYKRLNQLTINGLRKLKGDLSNSLKFILNWVFFSAIIFKEKDINQVLSDLEKIDVNNGEKIPFESKDYDRDFKYLLKKHNVSTSVLDEIRNLFIHELSDFSIKNDLSGSPFIGRKKDDTAIVIELFDSKGHVNAENLKFLKKAFQLFDESNDWIDKYGKPRSGASTFSLMKFKWSGLSSGEIALFNIYSRLKLHSHRFHNKCILLIDEPDTYLNPQWQKRFMNDFLKSINWIFGGVDQYVHMIFTTHSPIMLSDIPGDNVIYLGRSGTEKPETFGANIHSLYKDSFFLEGGLIGEFAKAKINDVISKFHKAIYEGDQLASNNIVDEKESILKLIEIIGDDVVRSKLLQMLHSVTSNNPKKSLKEYYQKKIAELE